MTTALYVVAIAAVVIGVLRLLEGLAQSHESESFRVSEAWLNEHIRGRRDI